MIQYIEDNAHWIFSGYGVAIIVLIISIAGFFLKRRYLPTSDSSNAQDIHSPNLSFSDSDLAKKQVRILFIDDKAFDVVTILKKSGWDYTKRIKDVASLDSTEVREANIIFIDINDVGVALKCKDEGLGLAKTLKEKYPNKYVVIYSAETAGDRFHEALRLVDDFLPKNSDAFRFEQIIERFFVSDNER